MIAYKVEFSPQTLRRYTVRVLGIQLAVRWMQNNHGVIPLAGSIIPSPVWAARARTGVFKTNAAAKLMAQSMHAADAYIAGKTGGNYCFAPTVAEVSV